VRRESLRLGGVRGEPGGFDAREEDFIFLDVGLERQGCAAGQGRDELIGCGPSRFSTSAGASGTSGSAVERAPRSRWPVDAGIRHELAEQRMARMASSLAGMM